MFYRQILEIDSKMRYDGYFNSTSKRTRPSRKSEVCRGFACMPPWFILWRWFSGGQIGVSRDRFMERKLGKEEIGRNSDVIKRRNGGSRNCEASSSSGEDDVPEIGKDTFVNLGVGFGLIYFVRDELNKMVVLRQNIEMLLQEFRKQLQNQENKPCSMPSKSITSSSFSNTTVQETSDDEENNSDQRVSSHDVERHGSCFSSTRYRREKSLRMDQLEAELEAEFDRLQITSDSFNYSRQQYSEVVNVEDSAPELSLNVCYEEEEEDGPHDDEFYGVSPRELERKLYEVLETRQEERIKELESALVYAMQQLEEKERELASWKDTARYASRRFPAIPGFLRQVKEDAYCMEPLG